MLPSLHLRIHPCTFILGLIGQHKCTVCNSGFITAARHDCSWILPRIHELESHTWNQKWGGLKKKKKDREEKGGGTYIKIGAAQHIWQHFRILGLQGRDFQKHDIFLSPYLSWIIVPQFFMETIRVCFFTLNFGNDVKNFRIRTARAAAVILRVTVWVTGALWFIEGK